MHLDQSLRDGGFLLRQQRREDRYSAKVLDVLIDLRLLSLHQDGLELVAVDDPNGRGFLGSDSGRAGDQVEQRQLAKAAPLGDSGGYLELPGVATVLLRDEDLERTLRGNVKVVRDQVTLCDELLPFRHRLLPGNVGQLLDAVVVERHHGGQIIVRPERAGDQGPLLVGLRRRGFRLDRAGLSSSHGLAVGKLELLVQAQAGELLPPDLEGDEVGLCRDRGGARLVPQQRALSEVVAWLQGGEHLRDPIRGDLDAGLTALDDEELGTRVSLLDHQATSLELHGLYRTREQRVLVFGEPLEELHLP
mmetsp:Transcript_91804/g.239351  ORF Transcript_91804/g.239351 Transcript_91804/m.239351 type:complete len:305 (+) Transcript_91804:1802-2716(+)